MKKNKINQDVDTGPKKNGKTALPWIFIFLSCIITLGLVCAWTEMGFSSETYNKTITTHKANFSQIMDELVNKKLEITQNRLNNIAKNDLLINSLLVNDTAQIDNLSLLISNSFNDVDHIKIIPWDMGGTASLAAKNIIPRNNIELMLLSQAGSKKNTAPEAYLHEKKWYVAFASPVIKDNNVIGVLLLTFNNHFLSNDLNVTALKNTAKINFQLKSHQDQIISSIGEGAEHQSVKLDIGLTDGEINILFNQSKLDELVHNHQPVYLAILIALVGIGIVLVIAYVLTNHILKKDVISIRNYAESLASLHKTKQPEINSPALYHLLDVIDALGQNTTKNAIRNEESANYKSPQANSRPAEKPAIAAVSEKFAFDHPNIFKEYDIRGLAEKQLTTDNCVLIGRAIGTKAIGMGISTIVTGRDGRTSSERLQFDLSRGIISTGCNVINIGEVPTPALYYATQKLATSAGVMVTGSHNPPEFNGFKIVLDNHTLLGDDIQNLLNIIESNGFIDGAGKISKQDIREEYIQEISSDIIIAKPMNIVIDAGNGMGGISSQLLNMLDCTVTELYCDVNGKFPNHGPDPMIESNLTDLINKVIETGADLGIAFDGDADRMVAITSNGNIIPGDKLLMLFAKDIVSRNAASNIIYDVKCSRDVEKVVSQFGGRSIMCKSGHSNMKAKMQETDALLGGEFTGHFYFKERWNGFDDGIYAALRLIELLSTSNNTLDEEIASLPTAFATNELHINIKDNDQGNIILKKLNDLLGKEPCKINSLDGIRAEFDNGWGLIRLSHTTNTLTLRFEGATENDLSTIKNIFKNALTGLNLNLSIPF